jgi:hypothetical protein
VGSHDFFQGSCSGCHQGHTGAGEGRVRPQAEGTLHRLWRRVHRDEVHGLLLKAKGLPRWFWGEAVDTVVYVLNRCSMKSIDGMTPFEVWHGRKPAVHHLRTFGCIMYVRNTTPHLLKLSKQSTQPLVDATAYQSIIVSLRYLVNTCPDLAFDVGYMSHFLEEPREDHLAAVKKILHYVAGTCNWGL